MHPRALFSLLALTFNVTASVLNLNIYTDNEASTPENDHKQVALARTADEPAWKKRDKLNLVPLVPEAKTEALPVEIEEGLINALGPRFANEFIKAAAEQGNQSFTAAGKCSYLKCAGTVIKAAPCIAAAIACKCPAPIVACPTGLNSLCNCIDCLPEVIRNVLGKVGICKKSLHELPGLPQAEGEGFDYSDFIPVSIRDPNLLAYRGDLPKTTLAEAEALSAQGFCPGVRCSSCSCCLGVCAFDTCVGSCLPTSSMNGRVHHDL